MMTALEWTQIIPAVTAAMVVMGGGARWLLVRVDEKNRIAAAAQSEARAELSMRLHEEIRDLRATIMRLQAENVIYMRRIYALENYIHQHLPGPHTLPDTPGWPPEPTPFTGFPRSTP